MSVSSPASDPAPPAARPRLRVLATGGTIAGAQTAASGGRSYQAATLSADALIAAVPELGRLALLEVEQVAAVASQDMDEGLWRTLLARTQAALEAPGIGGVVITHGTDTMEETGYFLNLTLRSTKPVVLVGAMRPATSISPDGPMNLFNATAVAAHPEAGGRGVLIVANETIHFAREVSKSDTTHVGTFRASHRGFAGVVNAGRLHLYGPPMRRHTAHSAFALGQGESLPSPLPQVEVIYAHAGMGRQLIDAAVRSGVAGLVIAGVGHGNLHATALAAVAEAARAGVAVVRSTRTGGGVVERNIEIDDDALGLIAADELSPAKARILLQLGLTRTRDVQELQELFFTH